MSIKNNLIDDHLQNCRIREAIHQFLIVAKTRDIKIYCTLLNAVNP